MGDEKSVIVNDNNSAKTIELRRLEAKDPKASASPYWIFVNVDL